MQYYSFAIILVYQILAYFCITISFLLLFSAKYYIDKKVTRDYPLFRIFTHLCFFYYNVTVWSLFKTILKLQRGFSDKSYILLQYTLKSMQLLCHCVYVSLLVYWIAYKLAYFTAFYSQHFLQGQHFPSWFWRSFFVCFSLVIVNRF